MGGNAAKERRKLKRLAEQQIQKAENAGEEKKARKSPSDKDTQNAKVMDRERNISDDKRNDNKNKNMRKNSQPIKKFEHKKGHGNKKQYQKSGKKIPIKVKKDKKPKHLARKMKNETDPELLRELQKQQLKINEKKLKRREKFKKKVIETVGGEQYFNSDLFDELLEKGNASLENIVKAVKIDASEVGSMENERSEKVDEDKVNLESLRSDTKKDEIKKEDSNKQSNNNTLEEASTDSEVLPETEMNRSNEGKVKKRKEEVKSEDADGKKDESMKQKKESDDDDNSTSSSSDSEDGDNLTLPTGRTRGRRRRGRKDADAEREKQNEMKKQMVKNEEKQNETPKVSKEKRRCVGRKALTDFEVGKKYTGTVVYVKPKLGIFIDINCHNDAFCHISRCADGFVEEITDEIYKVGDVLQDKVRLVNIDRKKKRITASLQSDERIIDEESSNETWKKRQLDIAAKKEKKLESKRMSNGSFQTDNNTSIQEEENTSNTSHVAEKPVTEEPIIIDPDNMSPAELKRARKLQRRAERRKQKELTGISA